MHGPLRTDFLNYVQPKNKFYNFTNGMQTSTPTPPNNILFPDIETVRQYKLLSQAPERYQQLFKKKFDKEITERTNAVLHAAASGEPNPSFSNHVSIQKVYEEKAALFAEFGKVVCVSIGRIDKEGNLLIKTLCSRFEKELLKEVAAILSKGGALCAHNGIEFDYEFLRRRMIIHGISVPDILNTLDKKPWETALYDTVKMWSGAAWNYKASLDLLAMCFDIESSKSDMDGSRVGEVYYSMFDGLEPDELPFDVESKVLKRIADYCGLDVVVLVNVYLKIKGLPMIPQNKVMYV